MEWIRAIDSETWNLRFEAEMEAIKAATRKTEPEKPRATATDVAEVLQRNQCPNTEQMRAPGWATPATNAPRPSRT
ncbi:hypothetical protein LTR17_024897 [Elasticomyces elasticus]|nr:hypothetical protein LTR17_024897 [Elasticomyces elasticus]